MRFDSNILNIDPSGETERICEFIREQARRYGKNGAVVGLSGGIDSTLCVELCVRALGVENVFGLILPERESNPLSAELGRKCAEKLGIRCEEFDITPALEGFGAYRRRDEIIRGIFPEYDETYTLKISLPPDILAKDAYQIFTLTIRDPSGNEMKKRLNRDNLWGIIAATDMKQRSRMVSLYYYGEKMNYLVSGTTNKTEVLQGFFVKFGDGGVDIEPLAHLYKVQIFQMGAYLGVLDEVMKRAPSPDTYSYVVTDEEFFFRMPFEKLDMLLYAWENSVPMGHVCTVMNLSEEQVKRVYRDFELKFQKSEHLREPPPTLE